MSIISSTIKSYIAGFLDGDGCVMYQLIKRAGYKHGYQIRASIVFYQKTKNRPHLEWLKTIFNVGYIRNRNDDMTEYMIVGLKNVNEILKLLMPYLRLKKPHAKKAIEINKLLKGENNLNKFIKAAALVDEFKELNYSKRRVNTSLELIKFLRQNKLYPRND